MVTCDPSRAPGAQRSPRLPDSDGSSSPPGRSRPLAAGRTPTDRGAPARNPESRAPSPPSPLPASSPLRTVQVCSGSPGFSTARRDQDAAARLDAATSMIADEARVASNVRATASTRFHLWWHRRDGPAGDPLALAGPALSASLNPDTTNGQRIGHARHPVVRPSPSAASRPPNAWLTECVTNRRPRQLKWFIWPMLTAPEVYFEGVPRPSVAVRLSRFLNGLRN